MAIAFLPLIVASLQVHITVRVIREKNQRWIAFRLLSVSTKLG